MAELDGPWWIAEIHAAKAQSRVERKLWRAMADRLSAAAAVVALVALSLPGIGNAKTAQNQAVSDGLLTHSVYYVHNGPAVSSSLQPLTPTPRTSPEPQLDQSTCGNRVHAITNSYARSAQPCSTPQPQPARTSATSQAAFRTGRTLDSEGHPGPQSCRFQQTAAPHSP
ncbi:DUF3693 domain-containing protein [Stenotrophomonas lactitubi]|uniref:DUF3693 domain-containing protein n=1 Tax=Stenotrophomonas lactitubi TaxID=2045214 RepID=UPI002248EB9A|nr:DUF3693 domain-containing protein [Stenotrophomonas lactitubi]MCX2892958.1 DUF3693 domain-containing protein [Stenotrophomonas lactitubi]